MRRILGTMIVLAVAVVLFVMPVLAAPTIQDPVFQQVWNRQDFPVAQQVSGRSWTWGPAPITDALREKYVQSPEEQRKVQYFDKSRMEINNPAGDASSQWYVTNGLLPIELMTGRMQVGDAQFEFRGPARVSAIGDPDNFPTYADLLPLYQSPGAVNPNDLGQPATGLLNPDGSVTSFDEYEDDPLTVLREGANGHGVARAFLDFQNQRGLVYVNNAYVTEQVYDPLFVFGLPVSGAYWVRTNVGGEEVPVLFQIFERRVLTYNPENPAAFRVEMGNVGQHYYQWRYPTPQDATPAPTTEPTEEPYPAPGT